VGFTTLAVVAAVGATISAVGAVTGSKALTIAGGVIGAVGAIGGLAQSAGLLGDIAGESTLANSVGAGSSEAIAQGTTAAETASPFDAAAASGSAGIDQEISNWSQYGAVSGLNPSTGTTDIIDSVSGNVSNVGEVAPTTSVANTDVNPLGTVQANTQAPLVTPSTATDTGTASGSASAYQTTFGDSTNTASAMPPSAPPAPGAPGLTTTGPTGSLTTGGTINNPSLINAGSGLNDPNITMTSGGPSVFGKIGSFIKDNGQLTGMLAQGAMSFIAGATSSLTPAQVDALKAQATQNTAAANLYNQQAALVARQNQNMSQPLPVATRTAPVTGTPAGMINAPPPQQITGAA
jgi:hypothetical protein